MYYTKLQDGWPIFRSQHVIVTNADCSAFIKNYKFHVYRYFEKPEELLEAGKWADNHCNGKWLIGYWVSGFSFEGDAIHFKLMWI